MAYSRHWVAPSWLVLTLLCGDAPAGSLLTLFHPVSSGRKPALSSGSRAASGSSSCFGPPVHEHAPGGSGRTHGVAPVPVRLMGRQRGTVDASPRRAGGFERVLRDLKTFLRLAVVEVFRR